jgi:hypothetical protein
LKRQELGGEAASRRIGGRWTFLRVRRKWVKLKTDTDARRGQGNHDSAADNYLTHATPHQEQFLTKLLRPSKNGDLRQSEAKQICVTSRM